MKSLHKVIAVATYRDFGRPIDIRVVRDANGCYQLVYRGIRQFSTVRDLETMLLPTEAKSEEGYLVARAAVIKTFRWRRWLFPNRRARRERPKRERSPEDAKFIRDVGGGIGGGMAGCGCLVLCGGLLGVALLGFREMGWMVLVGLIPCAVGFLIVGRTNKIQILERLRVGRRPIPVAVKRNVWLRDGGACVYCGSTTNLHYDHIIPHSKGGGDTVENVQLLCAPCNLKKAASIG
ncbi:MAG TPA: HNH endonuclease [Gemmatimonadaceae bacterium]